MKIKKTISHSRVGALHGNRKSLYHKSKILDLSI